jgi:probable rRNA maturation factor
MRVPRKRIADLAGFVARKACVRLAAVDIAVVGADEMASLNERYLGHKGATDVLTFDFSDAPGHRRGRDGRGTHGRDAHATRSIDAQIIVCADVAKAVGPRHGLSAGNELLLYVTHGLLHLMGYDDQSAAGAAKMQRRAEELLREFGGKVIIAASDQTRRR